MPMPHHATKVSSALVATVKDRQLTDREFSRRIKLVRTLRDDAQQSYQAATAAILKFAVEYTALYQTVYRNAERRKQLDDALALTYEGGQRLRSIAGEVARLKKIQKSLPPSLETTY